MASVVMSPSNLDQSSAAGSPARKNLKRPAPVGVSSPSGKTIVPTIRTPGLGAPKSPLLHMKDRNLPSQLPRSPASANPWSAGIRNEDLKTPMTPPSAYSDFLHALSPAMSTPGTARSAFSNFSFTDRTGHLTPLTQPPSAASFSGHTPNESKRRAPPPAPLPLGPPPTSAASAPLVPPSPFVRPDINRRSSIARTPTTLKKLTIPESPSFAPIAESTGERTLSAKGTRSAPGLNPTSAASLTRSPYPTSAELRSPFSPTSWYQEGRSRTIVEPPKGAGTQTVQVRQVITRTVTYTRTPLEPAPKRRRKMREGEAPTPIDPRIHMWPEPAQSKVKAEPKEEEEQQQQRNGEEEDDVMDSESDLTGSTISSSDGSEQGSVLGQEDREMEHKKAERIAVQLEKPTEAEAEVPAVKVESASDGEKA